VHKLLQQAKRIAVARNRLRTEASLRNEMVSEEELKKWADKSGSGHGLGAPWLCSDRTTKQLFGVVLVWQSDTNRCFLVQHGRGTPTDEVATPRHFSVQDATL
jgi:hypothetical protein